jgi:hypothetical protein
MQLIVNLEREQPASGAGAIGNGDESFETDDSTLVNVLRLAVLGRHSDIEIAVLKILHDLRCAKWLGLREPFDCTSPSKIVGN